MRLIASGFMALNIKLTRLWRNDEIQYVDSKMKVKIKKRKNKQTSKIAQFESK